MKQYLEPAIDGSEPLSPMDLIVACMEQEAFGLLIDGDGLPPAFFDLSSGVAGELAQKLTNYGIRMAAVVPIPARYSQSFQDFAREANRSRTMRFFATREEAADWLTAAA